MNFLKSIDNSLYDNLDKFLSDNNLKRKDNDDGKLTRNTTHKNICGQDFDYHVQVVSTVESNRNVAFDTFTEQNKDLVFGTDDTTPVAFIDIDNTSIMLRFKPNPNLAGGSNDIGRAITESQECATAYCCYCLNRENRLPSDDEIFDNFAHLSLGWYNSIISSSKVIINYLDKCNYVFCREDICYPEQTESIHTIIKSIPNKRKDWGIVKIDSYNPSDIYALKESEYASVVKLLKSTIEDENNTLVNFSNILRELMQDKTLVGISLKKTKNPTIEEYNMDLKESGYSEYELLSVKDLNLIPVNEINNLKTYPIKVRNTQTDVVTMIKMRTMGGSSWCYESQDEGKGGFNGKGLGQYRKLLPSYIPNYNSIKGSESVNYASYDVLLPYVQQIKKNIQALNDNFNENLLYDLYKTKYNTETEYYKTVIIPIIIINYYYPLSVVISNNQFNEFITDCINITKHASKDNAPFIKVS